MSDPVFFSPTESLSLETVATLVKGRIARGAADQVISRVAPLDDARAGDLTFLDNPRYLSAFKTTAATAALCAERYVDQAPPDLALIVTRDPYRGLALVMQTLYPDAVRLRGVYGEAGISPQATIHPTARLEANVVVEPGAVIGAKAEIGSGTVIGANAVIGANVRIGRDGYVGPGASVIHSLIGNRVILHPGVRVGQDGFGFAMGAGGHLKMPQIGRVVIQDDVEIGANSTVDRGANRDTIIGEGTKIDNMVQIGHNVIVGRHAVLVAQVGIAGSTEIGDYVAMGGKAGLAGHLKIGSGAQIAGGSLVKDDVPAGGRYVGIPAVPIKDWTREQAALRKLVRPQGGDETP